MSQPNRSVFMPGTGVAGLLRSLTSPSPTIYALAGLLVVCVAMSLASSTFLSADNIANILRQVSINALIADLILKYLGAPIPNGVAAK